MKKTKTTKTVVANVTIGIQLAITIFIFVYGGHWLDVKYDKSPLFVGLGTVFGMVLGFYHLLKELNSMEERRKKEDDEKNRTKTKWM